MRFALFGVSILFAFVVVLLYFYSRQNRLLARHRHELSESNNLLSSLNDKLNTLNSRLLDTNSRRERLAKLYIDLCAKYIDRLSKFETLVKRKIKVGQVNDLLNTASSSRLSEEDAATFMNSFDTAFLDLYPLVCRRIQRSAADRRADCASTQGTAYHRTAHLRFDKVGRQGEFGDCGIAILYSSHHLQLSLYNKKPCH